MSDSKLENGDRIHITMLATVTAGGTRCTIEDAVDLQTLSSTHYLDLDGPNVVRVEPAPRPLPTEFGALILAYLNVSTAPRLLTLGQHDERPAWFCSGFMSAGPVYVTEIGPGWVQIDPETLRPLEGLS